MLNRAHQPKPLVVIKLGGSALTDKGRIYTPRIPVIHSAAKQVAEVCRHYSVVLVHGAGSYGHIPAKRFGLQYGFKNIEQLKGLTATKFKLLEWESILDEIFLKHGVPVQPIVASSFIVTRNGRIISAELTALMNWLQLGCVPMTGGDIVPDLKNGFSILSGDQIAAYIAVKLKAKSLVFALDVEGVYDKDPNADSKARLMRTLTISSAAQLISKTSSGNIPDVTGGIAGKLREAIPAARRGVPVYFVSLSKDQRLRKVILGEDVLSSRIVEYRA